MINQNWNQIQITRKCVRPNSQCFQRNRATSGKRVHNQRPGARRAAEKVGKRKGQSKSITRSLPGWWSDEFYDLRSRIVYGDPVDVRRLKHKRWLTHLIVADLVFGQCLIEDLYSLKALGADIRRLSHKYDQLCSGKPVGWNEQHLKDQLFGFAETHQRLGWLPRTRT